MDVVIKRSRDVANNLSIPPNAQPTCVKMSASSSSIANLEGEFALWQVQCLIVHFIFVGVHLDDLCIATPIYVVD